jgi:orotidine-5'-phosphate decarboxylase
VEAVGERETVVDPAPAEPVPGERASGGPSATELAARAVAAHCARVIDAVGAECVGVKLQLACFERLGAPGQAALAETVAVARRAGLLVIADGKRGDVPVTAAAYGQALFGSTPSPFGEVPGLGVDAATVNPLLGEDSIEPFVESAARQGAGIFLLVRTSNPGAADIEDLPVAGAGGETVSDKLAALTGRIGGRHVGSSGLSSVGAVVGATEPAHIARLRAAMPHAVMLVPGVGAQGGRVEDLAGAFAAGRASALVTVSRALVNAAQVSGGDDAAAAAAAATELRAAIWAVSGE